MMKMDLYLIPWPGPQVIPVMLTYDVPLFMAMQSSPIKMKLSFKLVYELAYIFITIYGLECQECFQCLLPVAMVER